MRSYTEKGIDILKDAVSILGVSVHYVLRGAIERGVELFSPSKEAYEMLKGAVVRGLSIVFKGYHEAGVTRMRPHRFDEPWFCKRILGYDANALYLSTILREMPSGKEMLVQYRYPMHEVHWFVPRIKDGSWFSFAEVDIEIPEVLWLKFEEMCPFFYNKVVTEEAVP